MLVSGISFAAVWGALVVGMAGLLIQKLILPLKNRRDGGLRLARDVTSPKKHWLFGHLLKFPATEEGLLRSAERAHTFPKMSIMWFGPTEAALECYHPDTVKPFLANSIPKATFAYKFLRPWLGNSILLASGDQWKRKRKLVAPAFRSRALESYAPTFNEVTDIMLEKFFADGRPQEIYETVNLMTLDAILRCCMSRQMDPQNKNSNVAQPFISAIGSLNDMVIQRIMKFHLWNDCLFRHSELGKQFFEACEVVHQEAETIIRNRRHMRAQKNEDNVDSCGSNRVDFLDCLLEARDEEGNELNDEDIRSEVDTFIFAGHDTTSSAISWTLYNLARHPVYQDKCFEELNNIIKGKDSIDWSDVKCLTYMKQCINESMRLYPPVTGVGRCPCLPVALNGGDEPKIVPPDTNVNVRIFDLHRHPEVWNNSQTYNPERFLPENLSQKPAYSFIPFSSGARNCIGKGFAMTLATIAIGRVLLRYKLYVDSETPKPTMKPGVVLRSKNGILVKMAERAQL